MLRIFFALALVCLSGGTAFADEPDNLRKQIDETRQDIVGLQKLQQQLKQEQDKVQQQLRDTEVDIGRLEQRAHELKKEIDRTEATLKRLHEKKGVLNEQRLKQQQTVAAQARVMYQNGHHEYLKLLLNQQSPERFSRMLKYYQYLGQARLTQVTQLSQTLQQLATVETEINQLQPQLRDQQQALETQGTELAKQHLIRKTALSQLRQSYKNRTQQLKERQQEQLRLEQALVLMETELALTKEALVPPDAQRALEPPFITQQGQLPWPVAGKLVTHFGDRPRNSAFVWDGVLIEAATGTLVKAIYPGRVIFADWLRGVGLLVILDHGNGYLSLYGHNQTLLRTAGDKVSAGDPIATVGNSGGQEHTALYFAIRHQGRPSDPVQWCRAQG